MVLGMSQGPRHRRVPLGDNRERLTCPDCGFIDYENPRVVVGAVVVAPGDPERILLCRRAIMPRAGFWTLPAGFLELGETAAEGAAREAFEEALARIVIDDVLGVYSIARIGQVQVIFRARLLGPAIGPTPESSEVGLFRWEEIPWGELAFPSVEWSLQHWRAARNVPAWPAAVEPG